MKSSQAILLVLGICSSTLAQEHPVCLAPSAEIPSREVEAESRQAQSPTLRQSIRRTEPTVSEELSAAIELFRDAYRRQKSPRVLILFNRSMEDNEDSDFVKLGKVQYGVSGKQGSEEYQEQGEASVSVRVAPSADAYDESSIQSMELAFMEPFTQAGAAVIDRDTAVRLHGIDEQSVFSIVDLPETQQAQVEAIRNHADILVAVKVRRGTSTIRKVSGDYTVEVPILSAKVIDLRDARVLAIGATDEVRVDSSLTKTASRVAGVLLQKLAAGW